MLEHFHFAPLSRSCSLVHVGWWWIPESSCSVTFPALLVFPNTNVRSVSASPDEPGGDGLSRIPFVQVNASNYTWLFTDHDGPQCHRATQPLNFNFKAEAVKYDSLSSNSQNVLCGYGVCVRPSDLKMFQHSQRVSVASLRCHKTTKHLFFFLAVVSLSFEYLGPKGPEWGRGGWGRRSWWKTAF